MAPRSRDQAQASKGVVGPALRSGAAWGVLTGAAVSTVATALDGLANPAGLFHGPAGTNWPVVLETAWSWFWPVALAVAPVVAVLRALFLGRKRPR